MLAVIKMFKYLVLDFIYPPYICCPCNVVLQGFFAVSDLLKRVFTDDEGFFLPFHCHIFKISQNRGIFQFYYIMAFQTQTFCMYCRNLWNLTLVNILFFFFF